MNENQFEHLIRNAKRHPLPDCPGSLEDNVLRRIHLGSSDRPDSRFDFAFDYLMKPTVIAATLVMTVLISSGITIITTRPENTEIHRQNDASKALDFEVFKGNEFFNLDAS